MKILSKTTVASTKYLELCEIHYENKNGKPSKWYSVERSGNTKAVMVVATKGEKLILIKEYRVPIGGYEWSFPAGLIDAGEDLKTAAAREMKEETGFDIVEFEKISPFAYNSAGMTNEAIAIAYCNVVGEIDLSGNEESEVIEVFEMTKAEVRNLLLKKGEMFSAKAWIIMDNFANTGI